MTARLQGNRKKDSERCVGVVGRRRRKSTGRGDRNFYVFVSSAPLPRWKTANSKAKRSHKEIKFKDLGNAFIYFLSLSEMRRSISIFVHILKDEFQVYLNTILNCHMYCERVISPSNLSFSHILAMRLETENKIKRYLILPIHTAVTNITFMHFNENLFLLSASVGEADYNDPTLSQCTSNMSVCCMFQTDEMRTCSWGVWISLA